MYVVAKELGDPDLPYKFNNLLFNAHEYGPAQGLRAYFEVIESAGHELRPWEKMIVEEIEERHKVWVEGKVFDRHFLDEPTENYKNIVLILR